MDLVRWYVLSGTGHLGVALLVMRLFLGLFFAISGAHKLLVPQRHEQLLRVFAASHIPAPWFMQWFVPGVEFLGGLALVLGLLTPIAAAGVAVICVVAACTDGVNRIRSWHPIDRADVVDDVLYLPEVLYVMMLLTLAVAGPGPWSLDAVIVGVL